MIIISFAAIESEDERIKLQDLYEENKSYIHNFAMGYAKNQDIAEEAIQNAFVYIIKNKEKYLYLTCREFRNSVVIIVRDRCKNIFKSKKLYLDRFVEENIDEVENLTNIHERSVDEEVILSYEYELIKKNMKSIDKISRRALEMKYIEGKSYKEIGEELGMTEKHVDTKLMRAKEKVRQLVGKELNYNE